MIDQNILTYSITIILIIIILYICLFFNIDKFDTIPPLGITNTYVKTVPTISEQEDWNTKFINKNNKYNEKIKDEQPFMWNNNNSLESSVAFPCLGDNSGTDRATCYSAPNWWYPFDKYDPKKFREIYYGDYFNPLYNYLGNAQDMYWDFKSVKNT